jgi:hypothetical protein
MWFFDCYYWRKEILWETDFNNPPPAHNNPPPAPPFEGKGGGITGKLKYQGKTEFFL